MQKLKLSTSTAATSIKEIKHMSLLSIRIVKIDNEESALSIYWLCNNTDCSELFLLSCMYCFDELDDADYICNCAQCNPYYIDNISTSNKFVLNTLLSTLPIYVTDFEFTIDMFGLLNKKSNKFYFYADNSKYGRCYMQGNGDMYASISFFDHYMLNIGDEYYSDEKKILHALVGLNSSSINSPISIIYNLDSIVHIVPVKKTNVIIVYKVIDENGNELIISDGFDLDDKLPRKKYKGMNLKKLQKEYQTIADNEYLPLFSADIDIKHKGYLLLKVVNKNADNRILFIMKSTFIKQLKDLIDKF